MSVLKFDCGCQFEVVDDREIDLCLPLKNGSEHIIKFPRLNMDLENIPMNCRSTWELFGSGATRGVWQLESNLGKCWSKRLKPDNMEELAALNALLRPGCVSGDTKIVVNYSIKRGRKDLRKVTIKKLYEKFNLDRAYKAEIISVDENSNLLFKNYIDNIIYTGEKEVFQPLFKTLSYAGFTSDKFYNLEFTLDHKFLLNSKGLGVGWIELKDIEVGDRVAVISIATRDRKCIKHAKGQKSFRNICFKAYHYCCVHCDWKEGALDVNHLEGNRKTNNSKENLCFMCPNHHRMYSEGTITKEQTVDARKPFELKNTKDIQWVEYKGKKYIGVKECYDIKVIGPNHNFIAGNVVVHNCLNSRMGEPPKSMTQRYVDRKFKLEEVSYLHPSLESSLHTTYGVLCYQEQAMRIAQDIAGFDLQQADILRKAIGKKKADIMKAVEEDFLKGCKETGIVDDEIAKEIFGWIRESQRYSFNKSHAVSYALLAYRTAYVKAHFPIVFYSAYLKGAQWKQKTMEEVYDFVQDARISGLDIFGPNLTDPHKHFYISPSPETSRVIDGLSDLRDVGESAVASLSGKIDETVSGWEEKNYISKTQAAKFKKQERSVFSEIKGKTNKEEFYVMDWYDGLGPVDEWYWADCLIFFLDKIRSDVTKAFVYSGVLDRFGVSRTQMLYEIKIWADITKNEKRWVKQHDTRFASLMDALTTLAPVKKEGGGTHQAKRSDKVRDLLSALKNPPISFDDTPDWMAFQEEKYLGIAVTCSKIDGAEDAIRANFTCRDFVNGEAGDYIVLAVEINRQKEIKTKNGKNPGSKMAFLEICDATGPMEATVFPKQWNRYGSLLEVGNIVLLTGERDSKFGTFVVKKAQQL